MFRVRHCRVTSLASVMLRMILEDHTLPACPRPVNVQVGKGARSNMDERASAFKLERNEPSSANCGYLPSCRTGKFR